MKETPGFLNEYFRIPQQTNIIVTSHDQYFLSLYFLEFLLLTTAALLYIIVYKSFNTLPYLLRCFCIIKLKLHNIVFICFSLPDSTNININKGLIFKWNICTTKSGGAVG